MKRGILTLRGRFRFFLFFIIGEPGLTILREMCTAAHTTHNTTPPPPSSSTGLGLYVAHLMQRKKASTEPVPLSNLIKNPGKISSRSGVKRNFAQMNTGGRGGYIKGTIHRVFMGQCVDILERKSRKSFRTYWCVIFAARGSSIGGMYAYGRSMCWNEQECNQFKKGLVYRLYVSAEYPAGGQNTLYLDIKIKRRLSHSRSAHLTDEILFPCKGVYPVGETLFQNLHTIVKSKQTSQSCCAVRGVVVNASNIIRRNETHIRSKIQCATRKQRFIHFELSSEDTASCKRTIRVTMHFDADLADKQVRRIASQYVWCSIGKVVAVYPCRVFASKSDREGADQGEERPGLSAQWKVGTVTVIRSSKNKVHSSSSPCALSSVTTHPERVFEPAIFINRNGDVARMLFFRPPAHHSRRTFILYGTFMPDNNDGADKTDKVLIGDESKHVRKKDYVSCTVLSPNKSEEYRPVAQIRAAAYDPQLGTLRRTSKKKVACWACLVDSESGGLVVQWVCAPTH